MTNAAANLLRHGANKQSQGTKTMGGIGETAASDVQRRLEETPMTWRRVVALSLTFALSMLDGYDVLSVTFAAPSISADWKIGKDALGILLSSGLVGMAVGSLALAPLADFVGRRSLVLLSLVLMAAGMLASSFAQMLIELVACRVLTGLGIGAMVALLIAIATEFSNANWRLLALSLVSIGYPVGGMLGGLLAAWIVSTSSWQMIFVVGFGVAALVFVAVLAGLPESPGFLLTRRGAKALSKLNAVLHRLDQPELASLPELDRPVTSGYRFVFDRRQIATTLHITVVYALMAFASYYVLSWLPQLVADAGFEPPLASLASSLTNLVGIGGALLTGAIARRGGMGAMPVLLLFGLGFAVCALGLVAPVLGMLLTCASACGFFLFASTAALFSVAGVSFTDSARASGVGFVLGVGRVASAAAPFVAGWFLASGAGRDVTSVFFGACALASGLILMLRNALTKSSRQAVAS